MKKKELGNFGEQIASEYLQKENYKIIKRNYYCRKGEIDIIAQKQKEIIFIEVKTRTNNSYGMPAEAVNPIKQRNIKQVANYFLYKNNLLDTFTRFDVIEIKLVKGKFEINHIKQIM